MTLPSGVTVASNLVPAKGATVLHMMLYLAPSIATVLLSPNNPSFATD